MNEVCVRGGLGTQLFEFLIGLAKYKENLHTVYFWNPYINNKKNTRKRPDLGFEFYIGKLYNIKDILSVENSMKKNLVPDINESNISLVSENIEFIKNYIKPIFPTQKNNLSLIHQRGWDTPFLDKKFYQALLLNKKGFQIISDDAKDKDGNLKDSCKDFSTIYNSDYCIGAWSMFTISAAVLNSNLKLDLIRHEYWSENVYGGINRKKMCINLSNIFIENFPNINWYNGQYT